MENKGYILIQDWMLELPLSLVETVAYAVIYGFSQDGESAYKGSLAYLAHKCKVSKDTVKRAASKLVEDGYVEKIEQKFNGVTFYDYRALPLPPSKLHPPLANCTLPPSKLHPHNKEYNKDINISISKGKFDFLRSLLSLGVKEQTAKDWMQVRKEKRAANTETAFLRIQQEIAKSGLTAEECIRLSAEHSWQGFKAEWLAKKHKATNTPTQESAYQHNRRLLRELMGQGYDDIGGTIDEQ